MGPPSCPCCWPDGLPDEGSPAVHVQADGGGAAAPGPRLLMNGEIPGHDAAWRSSWRPRADDLGRPRHLPCYSFVALFSRERCTSACVRRTRTACTLGGGRRRWGPGLHPRDVADGALAHAPLIVSPLRPEIVAQMTTITLGAPWVERANAWIMRSNAAPATPLTPQADIPAGALSESMATQVLSTTPIRDTRWRRTRRSATCAPACCSTAPATGAEASGQGRRRAIWRPRAHGDPEHLASAHLRRRARSLQTKAPSPSGDQLPSPPPPAPSR